MEPIGWARRYLRRSPASDGHAHFAPFDRGPAESHAGGWRAPPPSLPSRPARPQALCVSYALHAREIAEERASRPAPSGRTGLELADLDLPSACRGISLARDALPGPR